MDADLVPRHRRCVVMNACAGLIIDASFIVGFLRFIFIQFWPFLGMVTTIKYTDFSISYRFHTVAHSVSVQTELFHPS